MPLTSTTTPSTTTTTSTTTAQPYVAFQTTQIYLPANFNTSDIQIVEKKDANQEIISQLSETNLNNAAASMTGGGITGEMMVRYGETNPFWWQEGIQNTASHTTLSPEELEAKRERRRRRKENKRRRRRKHKHEDGGEQVDHDTESAALHEGGHHHHHHELQQQRRRRREVWNENFYQSDNYADETFIDPKDVEPNIFNANDTSMYHFDTVDEKPDNINFFDQMLNTVGRQMTPNSGGDNSHHNKHKKKRATVTVEKLTNAERVEIDEGSLEQFDGDGDSVANTNESSRDKRKRQDDHFMRHKRKSGKTTGALSRAKAGSSDSKSKSIDRHNKGGECYFF